MNQRIGIRSYVLSALVFAVAGCSHGSRDQPVVVTHVPPPGHDAAEHGFAAEPVALSARAIPPKLVVDGDVSEWGLDPKRNAVVVGIDDKKVVLAITWAHAIRPVLTVALASPAPALPEIGWSQRGGTTHALTDEACTFEQIPLIEAGWQNGARHPPEVAKACQDILARYDKMGVAYRERFIRRLRIAGDGVALLDGTGASLALSGAVVRAKDSSAEVELPLTALPETNQAPLVTLLAGAAFGELPEALRIPPQAPHPSIDTPIKQDPAWRELELEHPVGFGVNPDVLALVFEEPTGVLNGGLMSQISYAPARPSEITLMTVPDVQVPPSKSSPNVPGAIDGPTAPNRPALSHQEEKLLTTIESFGNVTVGSAMGMLVTVVGGKLVAHDYFGRPEATQRRGDDLHLFQLDTGGFNWSFGYAPPAWHAVAIKPDGKIVVIADEGVDYPGMFDAWEGEPKPFHDPDWKRFGLSGKRKGKPKKVTWQWDEKAARYVVSVVPKQ
ncbi:MAG: hypothetical protein HOW73_18620 [Polyangiaceae bacterium]|nr:hypothetical protein [Polyangiaceae bacterium]